MSCSAPVTRPRCARRAATSGSDPDDAAARSLLVRLAVAAVLFVPLSHLSVMFAVLPETRFAGWQWVLTALALPIVTWAAWPFHRVALRNARHRVASMETLISVGVTAATLWSLVTVFAAHPQRHTTGVWQALMGSDAIYLEVAAGVTVFVLAGRYFEARAKSKAGSALRALAALSAKTVTVLLADGTEMVLPAEQLKEEQRFVVRPGETIAADGLVVQGSASVDTSAMTGESKAGPGRVRIERDRRNRRARRASHRGGRRRGRRHPLRRHGAPRRGGAGAKGRRPTAGRPDRGRFRSGGVRHRHP